MVGVSFVGESLAGLADAEVGFCGVEESEVVDYCADLEGEG